MTDPQKELDIFVTDISECADIGKNATVGFIAVGIAGMDGHVAMPITTMGTISKRT